MQNKRSIIIFTLALGCSLLGKASLAQLVSDAYEEAPLLRAAELLPADIRQSGHYRVRDEVKLKGDTYVFDIDSNYGLYRVESMPMLMVRTHELRTLAQAIGQYKERDDRFAEELRGQLTYNADSLVDVVVAPFSMAGQLVDNIGQTAEEFSTLGTGTNLDETVAPTYIDAVSNDVVTGAHKRNVAFQLDLDPYSTNPKVQEFLNTVARARSGGYFEAGIATVRVPPSRLVSVDGGRLNTQVKRAVKGLGPAELNEAINEQLRQFGVQTEVRQAFLDHPHFSPRHKTAITAYLDYLRGVENREVLIRASLVARGEADALSFEMLARMLAYYHETVAPIQELDALARVPLAITEQGTTVVIMPVDYVLWNRLSDRAFSNLSGQLLDDGHHEPDLVLAGTASSKARLALESYGFTLREDFLLAKRNN